jgi:hypothetical protein
MLLASTRLQMFIDAYVWLRLRFAPAIRPTRLRCDSIDLAPFNDAG